MNDGLMAVYDLFGKRTIFRVPKYQRAYAWGRAQLEDFVDDFRNQDVDKDYFFGTILLQRQERRDGLDIIDIVDGQQRITTLVIFMRELTRRLRTEGSEERAADLEESYLMHRERHRLRVIKQDRDFFDTYIIRDDANAASRAETPSQKRALFAKGYFAEQLAGLSRPELIELADKVERTKVLVYAVSDSAQATLIFETTNDRGKPLTNLEKTKSFLMYKTYVVADHPDDHLESLQSRFARIYRDFERIEEQVDEDALLRYHFIGHEPWKSGRDSKDYHQSTKVVKERLNALVVSDQSEALKYIDRYSTTLTATFSDASRLLLDPPEHLSELAVMGRLANFYPLILKAYSIGGPEHPGFVRALRLMEIISFRVYGLRRKRSDTGRDYLYRYAKRFTGDFDALAEQLKGFIDDYAKDRDVRAQLMAPRFFEETDGRVQKYLFWQYENHLRKSGQPVAHAMSIDALTSKDARLKLSIEHIAPQTPETSSKVLTGEAAVPGYDEAFTDNYLHCLGNLTIDPTSANSSKKNADFEVKNSRYFSKAPFKTQTELERFVDEEVGGWTARSIERRREAVVEFAMAYWDATSC